MVTGANGCEGVNTIDFELLQDIGLPNVTGVDFEFSFNGVPLDVQDTVPACGAGICEYGDLVPTFYVDGVPTELTQPIYLYYDTDFGCGALGTYADGAMSWGQYPQESGWYPLHVHMEMHIEGCSDDSLVFDAYDSVYFDTGFVPVIQPLEDLSLCPGDTAMLVLECEGCAQLEWSGPAGTYVTSVGMDTAWVWGFGLYSVIATSVEGTLCVSVEYFTVAQAAPPPLFIEPYAVCPGDTALLYTTFPSTTYVWSGPSGPLPVDNDSLYVTEIGSYYLVVYTDQGCELYGGPAIMQQFATPNMGILPDNVLCPGESTALEISGGGLETIAWDPPLSGGNLSQSVNAPGTYTCTVTACGITFQLSATIYASSITASIPGGPFTICGGGSVLLDGPSGDYDYLWTPGNSVEEDLLVTSAGSYQVQVTDTLGCSATSNAVDVLEQQFTQPVQAEGDSLCAGDDLVLQATGSGTLAWYGDEALTELLAAGSTLTGADVTASDTLYVAQTEGGCTGAPLPVVVTVLPPPPTVSITGDTVLCEGDELLLTAAPPGAQQYVWSTPQGPASGEQYSVAGAQTADAGIYTSYISSAGCDGLPGAVSVTVQAPLPDPVITGTTVLCEGDLLTLTVAGVQAGSFSWTTPSGTVAGTALVYSTVATAEAAGLYTVLADGGECPDAASIVEVVIDDCGIIIPNVFTPNNDGNNDDFVVEGTAFTTFQFTVFNRWGQEVYASRNGRITWNGRDNGNSPLPDGVYFYELVESRSGKSMVHTGYIQLARGQ